MSGETLTDAFGGREIKHKAPRLVWVLNASIACLLFLTYQLWGEQTLIGALMFTAAFAIASTFASTFASAIASASAIAIAFAIVLALALAVASASAIALALASVFTFAIVLALASALAVTIAFAVKTRKWKLFCTLQMCIVLGLIATSTVVPRGVLLDGAYVSEWMLANPFTINEPLVVAPSLEGRFSVRKYVPKGWTIEVRYSVNYPASLTPAEWQFLANRFSITLPGNVVLREDATDGTDGTPEDQVQKWLKRILPQVQTRVWVRWFPPPKVWVSGGWD